MLLGTCNMSAGHLLIGGEDTVGGGADLSGNLPVTQKGVGSFDFEFTQMLNTLKHRIQIG